VSPDATSCPAIPPERRSLSSPRHRSHRGGETYPQRPTRLLCDHQSGRPSTATPRPVPASIKGLLPPTRLDSHLHRGASEPGDPDRGSGTSRPTEEGGPHANHGMVLKSAGKESRVTSAKATAGGKQAEPILLWASARQPPEPHSAQPNPTTTITNDHRPLSRTTSRLDLPVCKLPYKMQGLAPPRATS